MTSIEGKSVDDLVRLAEAGGSLCLDGRRYSSPDLTRIARALGSRALLTIANCEGKATGELLSIISAAPGRVKFA
jgi:hypothetical protein